MSDRSEMAELAGQRLGRRFSLARATGRFESSEHWILRRLIGLGGMAAVYEAEAAHGGRVAIKVLHPTHACSPRQRRRFLREAQVVRALRHPGVVRVHASGLGADGEAFLVMELLDGQSLSELSGRYAGRLPPERSLPLLAQALDALSAAHAAGVIHRDVKPANLFFTRCGQLKLLDFGVARACTPFSELGVESCDALVLGTPAFMPPEQARGCWHEVDARSDLWSLGATFFTLLSGEYVHGRGTPNELLGRAMVNTARSLARARPGLPELLVEFMARALSFERADRFQSARDMAAAVSRLARAPRVCAQAPAPSLPPARRLDCAETVDLADDAGACDTRSVAVQRRLPAAVGAAVFAAEPVG